MYAFYSFVNTRAFCKLHSRNLFIQVNFTLFSGSDEVFCFFLHPPSLFFFLSRIFFLTSFVGQFSFLTLNFLFCPALFQIYISHSTSPPPPVSPHFAHCIFLLLICPGSFLYRLQCSLLSVYLVYFFSSSSFLLLCFISSLSFFSFFFFTSSRLIFSDLSLSHSTYRFFDRLSFSLSFSNGRLNAMCFLIPYLSFYFSFSLSSA